MLFSIPRRNGGGWNCFNESPTSVELLRTRKTDQYCNADEADNGQRHT